jgi:hypothetical protein
VRIDRVRTLPRLEPAPGVAPALPTVVSPEIRRAVAGRRHVSVATEDPGGDVVVGPAVWGAGFALQFPPGDAPAQPARAAVQVGADPQGAPGDVAGLTLYGTLADGRLSPERATWWEGFRLQSADIPPPSRSAVVLPE